MKELNDQSYRLKSVSLRTRKNIQKEDNSTKNKQNSDYMKYFACAFRKIINLDDIFIKLIEIYHIIWKQ